METDHEQRAAEARPVFRPSRTPFGLNERSTLVADLVGQTGLIPADRLALLAPRLGSGTAFGDALVAEGFVSDEGVARVLASRYQLPLVDLDHTQIRDELRSVIPRDVLQRAVAVPFREDGRDLHVAIADPRNVAGLEELRHATPLGLQIAVAPRRQITAQLARIAHAPAVAPASAAGDLFSAPAPAARRESVDPATAVSLAEGGLVPGAEDGSDAPLVRLVNSVILQAAEDGASDVHFVPQEDALIVRFRVDGVLHEIQRIPKRLAAGVTTRLKVLAQIDIAERRKPQDGRISLRLDANDRILDIRVATLPTVEGETIVMRLLDQSKQTPTLESLGLSDDMRTQFSEIIKHPYGALLVTGPSGAGKSTTLYAALNQINRPEINIITIEDPVEYRLAGVNHIQVNVRAGLTFAAALRAIVRSDPDVVMVGEIRDAETAKISIEAAMTGHFVLSTLHTNDAPGAISRLSEMGVEPYLTGSAVSAVLAQRLARRLCTHCCELYSPSADELLRARVAPDLAASLDGAAFYRKRGCPRCGHTGYRGRIGVFQFLRMSESLQELAVRHVSREELERAALGEGMRSMWDDGIQKVAAGLTTIEELTRVLA